jgi:hypothetical protein
MDPRCLVPVNERALSLLIGRPITIDYTDKQGTTTTRTVTPRAFVFFHGHRAITAHCDLRNAERSFLLTRIRCCYCQDWPSLQAAAMARQHHEATQKLSAARKVLIGLWLAVTMSIGGCFFSNANITPSSVSVSGYTRRDGTPVSGHNRRPAGSKSHDKPFEWLRGLCVVVMIGSGVWIWFARQRIDALKSRLRRLSDAEIGQT